MRRRDFISLLSGAAAAWPLAAHAQQGTPLIGFLASASASGYARVVKEVSDGLNDTGYVEGRNLAVEYRWADFQYDQLPSLAADLVERKVKVIFATGSVISAIAAKKATGTIPVVFANGSDPLRYGLVASLNRPEGNVTGVTFYNSELGPKRIEIIRELIPHARNVAVLVNPKNPNAEPDSKEIQEAGHSIGMNIEIVNATNEHELNEAFRGLAKRQADALMVHIDALFQSRREQIIALAKQYSMPTMYTSREYVPLGGLISYGTNVAAMYRLAGTYVGRILKGAKPNDLPIQRPTKFDLVVNLKAAKALGLTIPESFLLRADEVIE